MIRVPDNIITWRICQQPFRKQDTGEIVPGRFELVKLPVPELKSGEVLVEIAGCGISHEDLFYFHEPAAAIPTFGHEISGKVVAGEASWIEKEVILTRRSIEGIYGGFSSHIPVAVKDLCIINTRRSLPLDHLAVISNSVSTAFYAIKQAALEPGDTAIVIGVGGIGRYCVQIAKLLGAARVIAVDIVESRIHNMFQFGADAVITISGKSPHEAAGEISRIASKERGTNSKWKIIETAGNMDSKETALNLIKIQGNKVVFIQSGIAETTWSDGNPGSSDQNITFSHGCPPEYYPEVIDLVVTRKIAITPFIQTRPMSWIHDVFQECYLKPSEKRTILTTDDFGLDDGSQECKSCR